MLQEQDKKARRPVRYESITFIAVEQRYSQPKLELCGVGKVKKLGMIVWEQRFIVEIDASSIIQMLNSPDPIPNSQMNRGIAYLHFFDAEFKHVLYLE